MMKKYFILSLFCLSSYGASQESSEHESRYRSKSACARLHVASEAEDIHRKKEFATHLDVTEMLKLSHRNMLYKKYIQNLEAKYNKGQKIYLQARSAYLKIREDYWELEDRLKRAKADIDAQEKYCLLADKIIDKLELEIKELKEKLK
jgi:hypothetical protein